PASRVRQCAPDGSDSPALPRIRRSARARVRARSAACVPSGVPATGLGTLRSVATLCYFRASGNALQAGGLRVGGPVGGNMAQGGRRGRVVIIGAGIGGLAAAVPLHRRGFEVEVY